MIWPAVMPTQVTTYRCADLDKLVPALMGVSKVSSNHTPSTSFHCFLPHAWQCHEPTWHCQDRRHNNQVVAFMLL
jgi:hypothetical protein